MSSAYETITEILASTFKVPESEMTPQSSLRTLDLDSLAVVEFLGILEQKSGVEIGDADLGIDSTLGEAADFVQARASS